VTAPNQSKDLVYFVSIKALACAIRSIHSDQSTNQDSPHFSSSVSFVQVLCLTSQNLAYQINRPFLINYRFCRLALSAIIIITNERNT